MSTIRSITRNQSHWVDELSARLHIGYHVLGVGLLCGTCMGAVPSSLSVDHGQELLTAKQKTGRKIKYTGQADGTISGSLTVSPSASNEPWNLTLSVTAEKIPRITTRRDVTVKLEGTHKGIHAREQTLTLNDANRRKSIKNGKSRQFIRRQWSKKHPVTSGSRKHKDQIAFQVDVFSDKTNVELKNLKFGGRHDRAFPDFDRLHGSYIVGSESVGLAYDAATDLITFAGAAVTIANQHGQVTGIDAGFRRDLLNFGGFAGEFRVGVESDTHEVEGGITLVDNQRDFFGGFDDHVFFDAATGTVRGTFSSISYAGPERSSDERDFFESLLLEHEGGRGLSGAESLQRSGLGFELRAPDIVELTKGFSQSVEFIPAEVLLGGARYDSILGDFNNDGVLGILDIDALSEAVASEENETQFDLTGDQDLAGDFLVTKDDLDFWVEEIFGSLPGDANLDGAVDSLDLNVVGVNWQLNQGATWSSGDFTGDGRVDALDLNIVGVNWGRGADQDARTIPEPTNILSLIISLPLALRRRRVTRKS